MKSSKPVEQRRQQAKSYRLAHAIEDGNFSPADASTVIPVIKIIELAMNANEQNKALPFN